LATYSFKEAAKFGRLSEVARYRHLDSVALSTYIRGVKSEGTIIAIQEELGRRLASERQNNVDSETKVNSKVAKRLLKAVVTLAEKIAR
jgi:hypothetical protein